MICNIRLGKPHSTPSVPADAFQACRFRRVSGALALKLVSPKTFHAPLFPSRAVPRCTFLKLAAAMDGLSLQYRKFSFIGSRV